MCGESEKCPLNCRLDFLCIITYILTTLHLWPKHCLFSEASSSLMLNQDSNPCLWTLESRLIPMTILCTLCGTLVAFLISLKQKARKDDVTQNHLLITTKYLTV